MPKKGDWVIARLAGSFTRENRQGVFVGVPAKNPYSFEIIELRGQGDVTFVCAKEGATTLLDNTLAPEALAFAESVRRQLGLG